MGKARAGDDSAGHHHCANRRALKMSKPSFSRLHYRHGDNDSIEHCTWIAIIQRCHNPKEKTYPRYGGRGIIVCDEWRYNYPAFLAHVGRRPGPEYSLDRINVNGNYEPGNVRWATRSQQQRNRRDNVMVEYKGKPTQIHQACEEAGLSYEAVRTRMRKGLTGDDLFKPVKLYKARCTAKKPSDAEGSKLARDLDLMSNPTP